MKIVEKFVSIDGEGPMAGELAVFVRFLGCNLRCSWCDTSYSWEEEHTNEEMTPKEVYTYIKQTNISHVTLTGGEPLIQQGIYELLDILDSDSSLLVHIETNGSVDIKPFKQRYKNIRYILDYKLGESTMTQKMCEKNLDQVGQNDVYKFVVASDADLQQAYQIIKKYNLPCKVYLSAVAEKLSPQQVVNFMIEKQLEGVKLQLQLHKFIWPKESRGV
ncbi:MAG: putative 7-carboxy-7-deazaguanine synthase QueE [Epulopiscium sp. Nele67-Bin004]|nr:MAG: putative 7-carboxy-7-deazaguanine synthase QueE [Epulopiscium sp. Nele67-Bin004]